MNDKWKVNSNECHSEFYVILSLSKDGHQLFLSWFDKLTMTLFLFREMGWEMGSGLAIKHLFAGAIMLIAPEYSGSSCKHEPELVNENETPPATIYCSAGSLFGDAGLLIQTAGGRAAGCGSFPLNRSGCIS